MEPNEIIEQRTGLLGLLQRYKTIILIGIIILLALIASDKIGWWWLIVSIIAVGIVIMWIDKKRTAKLQGLDKSILEIAKEASDEYYKKTGIRLDYTHVDAMEITPGSKKYGIEFKMNRVLFLYDAVLKLIAGVQTWSYTLPELQYYAEKSKMWEIISKRITDEDIRKIRLNPGIINP